VEREAMPVFFLAGTCGVTGIAAGLVALQGAPVPGGGSEGAAAAWGAVRDAAVTACLGLTLTLALALVGLFLHRQAREVAWAMDGRPGWAGSESRSAPETDPGDEREEEDR
jgi:hypothetical protein